jgi:hypothetical protein
MDEQMWLGVNDDVDAPHKREIRVNDVGPLMMTWLHEIAEKYASGVLLYKSIR